jgi:glycosyltransferase involved in cell wall biosynthesis
MLGQTSLKTNSTAPMRVFDLSRLSHVVYEAGQPGGADIAVVIPLYNYAHTIAEALASVVKQDFERLSVIVVDDCSKDQGAQAAATFLEEHASRFTRARVVRHHRNQGPSMARNTGIACTGEPYLFMLDPDNRLRRPALSRLMQALNHCGAAFAYSQLRLFGEEDGIGIADTWQPAQLALDNYIDAMALIRREALLAAGGYAVLAEDVSWEDYDLWCRFAGMGYEGVFVPELLCDYRVHRTSRNFTVPPHYQAMMAEMTLRHPSLFNLHDPRRKD